MNKGVSERAVPTPTFQRLFQEAIFSASSPLSSWSIFRALLVNLDKLVSFPSIWISSRKSQIWL